MSDAVTSDKVMYFGVKHRLKELGATAYVLTRPEIGKLAGILHPDETIEAFMYGAHQAGWGMLVATNRKLLFVDKMFLDLVVDEVPYSMVSSIDHTFGHVFAKVNLHSRTKDYVFRRVNRTCAQKFIDYVEEQMIDEQLRIVQERRNQENTKILNQSMNYHIPTDHLHDWVGN